MSSFFFTEKDPRAYPPSVSYECSPGPGAAPIHGELQLRRLADLRCSDLVRIPRAANANKKGEVLISFPRVEKQADFPTGKWGLLSQSDHHCWILANSLHSDDVPDLSKGRRSFRIEAPEGKYWVGSINLDFGGSQFTPVEVEVAAGQSVKIEVDNYVPRPTSRVTFIGTTASGQVVEDAFVALDRVEGEDPARGYAISGNMIVRLSDYPDGVLVPYGEYVVNADLDDHPAASWIVKINSPDQVVPFVLGTR